MAISLVLVLALAIYPEQLIENTSTHLLTIVVGVLLLVTPLRVLLTTVVPDATHGSAVNAAGSRKSAYGWGLVSLIGFAVGTLLFVAEMTEGPAV